MNTQNNFGGNEKLQRYYELIVNGRIRQLDQLSAQTGEAVPQLKESLRYMIACGMLYGTYIDEDHERIVLPGDAPATPPPYTPASTAPAPQPQVTGAPTVPVRPAPQAPIYNAPTATPSPTVPVRPAPQTPIYNAPAVTPTPTVPARPAPQAPRQPMPTAPRVPTYTVPTAAPQAPRQQMPSAAPRPAAPAQRAPAAAKRPASVVKKPKPKIPFPYFATVCWLIFLLSLLFTGFMIGTSFFIIAAVLDIICLFFLIIGFIQAKNRFYCKSCKYRFDFGEDVEYRQIGHKVKTYSFSDKSNSDHQLRSREFFKLHVTCTCPHCGRTKQFKAEYVGRDTYYDGSVKDNDPEQSIENYFRDGIGGSKRTNLLLAGAGILIVIITLLILNLSSAAGAATASNSSNDPEDYYATYYGIEDGTIYTLKLEEDHLYSLTTMRIADKKTDTVSGSFYYKNAEDIKKSISDRKYDYEDALLLATDKEDMYIVVWLLGENGEDGLELNEQNIVFDKTPITPDSYLEESDPKDYYDTYSVIDDYILQTLTLTKSGFTWTVTDFNSESVKTGTYQFVPKEDIGGYLSVRDYNDKDALVLEDEEGDNYVLWLLPYGSRYKVEFNGDAETMTQGKKSLDVYLDDGNDYSGTYQYSAENTFTLFSSDGSVTNFYLDGELQRGFKYSFASAEYIQGRLKKSSRDGIVLYDEQGRYYVFEITSSGLKIAGTDIVFEKKN